MARDRVERIQAPLRPRGAAGSTLPFRTGRRTPTIAGVEAR